MSSKVTTSQRTPILAGFYPDPSICRVGDTYYLATSSFEYRPGVPVWSSTDLVNWQPVGHVFDRPSQLADTTGAGSGGIFAPTLRHHDDRFWLTTTNTDLEGPEQLIVHSTTPHGPWSEPVYTSGAVGIDPDLSWDGETCYLTWAALMGDDHHIAQARVDPETGTLLEPPRRLWTGTGLAFPEGPHLIRRGEWWYLLIAEGGTERGHCVSVARSTSPCGPFETGPQNPIFTHRSTGDPVQNTGHADLVERPDGSWAMVYLGVRPRGTSPGFHVNGRETFVAGVDWVHDWPVVDPGRFNVPHHDHSFVDDFSSRDLAPRWISPGAFPTDFTSREDHGIVLDGTAGWRFLGVRTRDDEWEVAADLVLESGQGALLVRMDEDNWCGIEVHHDRVIATQNVGGVRVELGHMPSLPQSTVRAVIASHQPPAGAMRSGPDLLRLGIQHGGTTQWLGCVDGRYLATEVAGGFTGRVVGLASSGGRLKATRFSYSTG